VGPLRIYFQDLIELWGSRRELPSCDLILGLVANLGNIDELMLQGLFSAEKSVLIELGYSIITLDTFSTLMLKGSCTLFQQLPHLIEVTGNSGLRWTYIIKCINNQELWHVIENVEAVIEEGVQHFATGTHTPAEGNVSSQVRVGHD
jgi:hypothetical protein